MIQKRICKECGCSFDGGPRAYYCPGCRIERTRETNRTHKRRLKMGSTRKLGDTDKCERCGKEYTVNAGLQRFCPDCQEEHAREYDKITSLKYYHQNKVRINPLRNIRRHTGPIKCAWCGKEFEPHDKKLTCSPECSQSLKNHKWNIRRIIRVSRKLKKSE